MKRRDVERWCLVAVLVKVNLVLVDDHTLQLDTLLVDMVLQSYDRPYGFVLDSPPCDDEGCKWELCCCTCGVGVGDALSWTSS